MLLCHGWTLWAKSFDFSLEGIKGSITRGDERGFHIGEGSGHLGSVISSESGEAISLSVHLVNELGLVVSELLDHLVSDGGDSGDESIFLVESLPDESLPLVIADRSVDVFDSLPEDLEELFGEHGDSSIHGSDESRVESVHIITVCLNCISHLLSSVGSSGVESAHSGIDSITHSLGFGSNEGLEVKELWFSEFDDTTEAVEKSFDGSLLWLTSSELEFLLVGVVDILDLTLKSLSFEGSWGVS